MGKIDLHMIPLDATDNLSEREGFGLRDDNIDRLMANLYNLAESATKKALNQGVDSPEITNDERFAVVFINDPSMLEPTSLHKADTALSLKPCNLQWQVKDRRWMIYRHVCGGNA